MEAPGAQLSLHPGPSREPLPVGGAGAGGSDSSIQELQDFLITPTPNLSSASLCFLDFSLRVRCERVNTPQFLSSAKWVL